MIFFIYIFCTECSCRLYHCGPRWCWQNGGTKRGTSLWWCPVQKWWPWEWADMLLTWLWSTAWRLLQTKDIQDLLHLKIKQWQQLAEGPDCLQDHSTSPQTKSACNGSTWLTFWCFLPCDASTDFICMFRVLHMHKNVQNPIPDVKVIPDGLLCSHH